jgi:hypothetical protein
MADANATPSTQQQAPPAPPPPAPAPLPPSAAAAALPPQVGPWILERQIGAGSFATVWRARHHTTGEQAAVKAVDRARLAPKLREALAGEVAVLRRARHPNVVRLLDLIEVRRSCVWRVRRSLARTLRAPCFGPLRRLRSRPPLP